jgi:hypothetical protein
VPGLAAIYSAACCLMLPGLQSCMLNCVAWMNCTVLVTFTIVTTLCVPGSKLTKHCCMLLGGAGPLHSPSRTRPQAK